LARWLVNWLLLQDQHECLEPIRAAGFSLIEVCSFPAHLDYHDSSLVKRAASLIQDLGLEPYSFHAPFADNIDITAIERGRQKIAIDELLRAAESAAVLGVRNFVIHPGPEQDLRPVENRLGRFKQAAKGLNKVATRCEALGIKLVFENMLPHLSFGHVSDLLWILGAIESTSVGVCLDTGHAYLSGETETVIHKLSGHLWMLHANDNDGVFDDHKPPGSGRVDWLSLLRQLAESDFRGALILEIAGNEDSKQVLENAQAGRTYLRDVANQVGSQQI
jgi:sugar phosphate isomerase/epimerase